MRPWRLADLKDSGHGWWEDPDGISHQGRVSAVASGLLDFCGCGQPRVALAWVLGGLDLLAELKDIREKAFRGKTDLALWATLHGEWRERTHAHFGTAPGAVDFFWYWCCSMDLEEHGSSVPGWLTERGEQIRDDIRALLGEPDEDNEEEEAS